MDPPVLIMDEPSAALDLLCKSFIRQYMAEYKKRNGIILITTHDEQELDLCDRILIMRQGILHEEDPSLRGDALLKAIV